jgi:uncharacterized membrane protein
MTHPWLRLIRHRWLDERDAKRALGPQGLARIQARVAASEALHTGQIRVCIEAGLPYAHSRRQAPVRERAVALFGELGVWDTAQNNGVLIYLLLAEHTIEIVADRGLNTHVPSATWAAIIDHMKPGLRAHRFADALIEAVDAVDVQLRLAFPRLPGHEERNELPDAPVLI